MNVPTVVQRVFKSTLKSDHLAIVQFSHMWMVNLLLLMIYVTYQLAQTLVIEKWPLVYQQVLLRNQSFMLFSC